jgi:hypothetical protein
VKHRTDELARNKVEPEIEQRTSECKEQYRLAESAMTVSPRELEVEPEKADKPCYGILFDFPRAMAGLARILIHGRKKYGGTKAGRALPSTPSEPCYESLLRHYEAIVRGEEIDPDSGEPHVMCLLANAFLAADKWGYHG